MLLQQFTTEFILMLKVFYSNNGHPVLTVNLTRKTKQGNKKNEICQFCARKGLNRGSLGTIKVEMENCYFYFLLNTCHHIKIQKNLLNSFREILYFCIFQSKFNMSHYLKINNQFYQFLLPAICCNFRKTEMKDLEKTSKLLVLGLKMTHLFTHLLLPATGMKTNF